MHDIRYVCISDTHFGATNSLLTNLEEGSCNTAPAKPSPTLVKLVDCLRELISKNEGHHKPELILNGDILELALNTDNQAAMVFEHFVRLAFPENGEPLFERLVYIPGNHDHHLWETARETQYLQHLARIEAGKTIDVPRHATKMFKPTRVPACFLEGIARRLPGAKNIEISTIYPNYGVLGDEGRRCVVFTHGHFTEPMYTLMTTLRSMIFPNRKGPRNVGDLEAENFAWIDFFWSTMGRSGDVGNDIELVYDRLQDPKQLSLMIDTLATSLSEKYQIVGETHGLEKFVLERLGTEDMAEKFLFSKVLHFMLGNAAGTERHTTDTDTDTSKPLSADSQAGLKSYVEGPLLDQIMLELSGNMPQDLTFIFGHTHKPYEEDDNFHGYPQWVSVFNTGGWVVDTERSEPQHGGALILIDEDLNAASLRMYNEAARDDQYAVRVEAPTHKNAPPNPFQTHLAQLIDPKKSPWQDFSSVVPKEVKIRADNLRDRINCQ